MPTMKLLLVAFGMATKVATHGIVTSVIAGGKTYPGFDTRIGDESSKPTVGWRIPDDKDLGYITPDQYAAPNIICHRNAAPASESAVVEAGDSVELQWTTWPDTHHGPVITYLANCHGSCQTVDKTQLKFNKIEAVGLYSNSTTPYTPGKYASDQLIQNGNKWTVTIPSTIAKGHYVLRHEIIALHSAFDRNGAQNYPQCINLEITGSGTDELASGTLGENLYKSDEPGILIHIYQNLNYIIPGPPMYSANGEYKSAPAVPVTSQSGSTTAAGSFISHTSIPAAANSISSDSATATAGSPSTTTSNESGAFSTGTAFRNTSISSTATTSELIPPTTPSATLFASSDTSPTATQPISIPINTLSSSISYSSPPSPSFSSASSDTASVSGAFGPVDSSNSPSKLKSKPSSSSYPSSGQSEISTPSSTATAIPLPEIATVEDLLDLLWRVVARLRQMNLGAGTNGAGNTRRKHARDLLLGMDME